jgi:hypothetical protein
MINLMGSGKGKARRAQATAHSNRSHAKTISYAEEKWAEFIEKSDLGTTNVYEYYLGQNHNYNYPLDADDYKKLLEELFQDAVAVGAITLHSPYHVDDFAFIVKPHQSFTYIAEITRKDNLGVRCILENVLTLSPKLALGDDRFYGVLSTVAICMHNVT